MKYDEVYHLYVNMTLDNGQTIGIEKKKRVNVAGAGFPTVGLEASNMLKINCNVVLKDMIEKADRQAETHFIDIMQLRPIVKDL